MTNRHTKRCSISLIVREMQMKTSYSLGQLLVKKKEKNNCLVGMQNGATTMENSMAVLQKIKNRTTI